MTATMMNKMKSMFSRVRMAAAILAMALVMGIQGASVSEANPNIQYNCTNVSLQSGVVRLSGVLYNAGDEGAYVTDADIRVQVQSDEGTWLYDDSGSFHQIGIYLAPGDSVKHNFNIKDETVSGYDGMVRYHCAYTFYYN